MDKESLPVRLARQSLEHYFRRRELLSVPDDIPEPLRAAAGAFVSLKAQGELRGCIGTLGPVEPTVAGEIIANAVSAATQDPRFSPVTPEELAGLTISVDILSAPEAIDSPDKLDPKRYGVIVRKGRRTGLLLPDLAGVDTVEEQVGIAMSKAGLSPQESIELYRFTVTRYE